MKSGLLIILVIQLFIRGISNYLYQKGLPKSLTFFTDNAITDPSLYLANKNSPMECSLEWMDNPSRPAAFTFDNKTQSCQGYNWVYGLTSEVNGQEAFLLRSYKREGCNDESVLEEYKEITTCMPGWFAVGGEDGSVFCYRTIGPQGYTGHIVTGACKEKYPYSQAASIHSEGEAIEIAKLLTGESEVYGNYYGVNIGLVQSNEGWKWMDGSELRYNKLQRPDGIKKNCEYMSARGLTNCKNAAMYWQWTDENPSKFLWGVGYSRGMSVLCKYKLY